MWRLPFIAWSGRLETVHHAPHRCRLCTANCCPTTTWSLVVTRLP